MHPEALSHELKALLSTPLPAPGFYLAGGTALALQLGHRVSVDLDWMSGTPIPEALLEKAEKTYAAHALDLRVRSGDELTLLIDGIKVTFLYYHFPLLFPTVAFSGIAMADVRDIAGMKAYAIGRRATYKDYIDLYFIIKQGIDLNQIITFSEKKFGNIFDPRLFLEQLVYFGDLVDTNIQFLGQPLRRDAVEKFFEQEAAKVKLR